MKSADCLIWQTLASVLVPGFVINRIVKASRIALPKGGFVGSFGPTICGLAAIPFIITPIDKSVDYFMDETYRKYIK